MSETVVYINVLQDSLTKKLSILKDLLTRTQRQKELLAEPDETAMEQFDQLMQEKASLIDEMKKLDEGFQGIYDRVGLELKANKYQYQQQIMEMQNLIRAITDIGVRLEGMEQQNKVAFQNYINGQRQEIRQFRVNHKTAASYYQNMANQHHEWQTYFVDQKK